MFYPVHGRRYFVLGLGRTGLATIEWLKKQGASEIFAWDDQTATHQIAQIAGITLTSQPPDWRQIDACIQSPGIALTHPVTQAAREINVPILTDCDLFRIHNPDLPLIGVTGTNGKSTTTALIHHILVQAGHRAVLGGNIGTPVLSLDTTGIQYGVLELSSYQLELSHPLNLEIAAWLNLQPDHLERHGTMEAYRGAKAKIFDGVRHRIVLGVDDSWMAEIYREHPEAISVSLQQSADITVQDGILTDTIFGEQFPVTCYARLRGLHNQQNMAVAYGVTRQLKISREQIQVAFETFPGLAHRQQIAGVLGPVTFINDSKATNAEATARALACFDNIYWIAGGRAKSEELTVLRAYFPKIREAFLIGESEQRFAEILEGFVPYQRCGTLKHAVTAAYDAALQSNQTAVVLLAPACASFDQYRDFEARGEEFCMLVQAIMK